MLSHQEAWGIALHIFTTTITAIPTSASLQRKLARESLPPPAPFTLNPESYPLNFQTELPHTWHLSSSEPCSDNVGEIYVKALQLPASKAEPKVLGFAWLLVVVTAAETKVIPLPVVGTGVEVASVAVVAEVAAAVAVGGGGQQQQQQQQQQQHDE